MQSKYAIKKGGRIYIKIFPANSHVGNVFGLNEGFLH